MEEGQLIRLLKQQPAEGLHILIQQYQSYVHTIISHVLGTHQEDIEECSADTFVKVWKNIDKLDVSKGKLKSYIAAIARNEAIDRYHKLQREQVISLDENCLLEQEDEDVLKTIINKERESEIHTIILSMAALDQKIMIRKYFLIQSVKDIAMQLGLSEKQVENRLYLCRKHLKKALMSDERGARYE